MCYYSKLITMLLFISSDAKFYYMVFNMSLIWFSYLIDSYHDENDPVLRFHEFFENVNFEINIIAHLTNGSVRVNPNHNKMPMIPM